MKYMKHEMYKKLIWLKNISRLLPKNNLEDRTKDEHIDEDGNALKT